MRFVLCLSLLSLISCAQGHCRKTRALAPELAALTKTPPSAEPRVFVYKPDGSQQCGLKKGIPVDVMAKELKGISIFSQKNQSDGRMHMQVCGGTTGRINVYEISIKDLEQAKKKGFIEWKN